MKDSISDLLKFLTNRLFVLFIIIFISFYSLCVRLFNMQIIDGEMTYNELNTNTQKDVSLPAPRGIILDKYGRPLAINKSAFTVKIDRSLFDTEGTPLISNFGEFNTSTTKETNKNLKTNNLNEVLLNLVNLFKKNNEKFIDEMPISLTEPFVFLSDDEVKSVETPKAIASALLQNTYLSENWSKTKVVKMGTRERIFKKNMNLPDDFTAEQSIANLREKFIIDENWSNTDARNVISIRCELYMQYYLQYAPITLANYVSDKTVAKIEEENAFFHGIVIDVESLREYPSEKYMSHMLGYIGNIGSTELQTYKDNGYNSSDKIGKTGLEKSFESELKGKEGKETVKVNNVNRRVGTLHVEEPIPGNKIFLTIDLDLQKKAYNFLENQLKEILISKLQGASSKEARITEKQLFSSMVKSNNIDIKKIFESGIDTYSYKAKNYILLKNPDIDIATKEGLAIAKASFIEAIDFSSITLRDMIFILKEQDLITMDEDYIARIKNARISVLQVLIEKIQSNEITPQMTNLDPSTGSIVLVDAHTGDVIVAVSYPSYDNNKLVNILNNTYYSKLASDASAPFNNRAFTEARAPGSTFKMITAIAGLETGTISPSTTIYDETSFTKAGLPPLRCWSPTSHSHINVSTALEVSCNYFFTETSYRMGNTPTGTKLNSIESMNKYMIAFGLNDKSGVEIGEYNYPSNPDILKISSPELKQYQVSKEDVKPDPKKSADNWYDGNTVATSIGQFENRYTSAIMAKYIATLANGGYRYKLHLLDKISKSNGSLVKKFEPVVENVIELKPSTWKAVYDGMLLVTTGSRGTGTATFRDFPISVGGKTGTAQEIESRNDHASFAGFAPFDKPEVAVYVMIPFGDTKTTVAPAAQVARNVLGSYMGLDSQIERPAIDNSLVE